MPKYRVTYQPMHSSMIVVVEGDDYDEIAEEISDVILDNGIEEMHFVTLSDSIKTDDN